MSNSTDMPNLPTIHPDLADILATMLKRRELVDWTWWDMGEISHKDKRVFKFCGYCTQYWKLQSKTVRTIKDHKVGVELTDVTILMALDDKCKRVFWYSRMDQ